MAASSILKIVVEVILVPNNDKVLSHGTNSYDLHLGHGQKLERVEFENIKNLPHL